MPTDTVRVPNPPANDARIVRVLAVPAVAGLLWLSWVAASHAWAETAIHEAAGNVTNMNATGQLPSYEEWKVMREPLTAARERDRANPNLYEAEGNLFTFVVKDGERYRGFAAEGVEAFSRAVVLRPASAFAWLGLAEAKYRNGEQDALFYRALANAAQLGPNEPPVQLGVTDLGLAAWDELPADLRETLLQLMRNSVRRNTVELLNIAERRGRLEMVCSAMKLGKILQCSTNGSSRAGE